MSGLTKIGIVTSFFFMTTIPSMTYAVETKAGLIQVKVGGHTYLKGARVTKGAPAGTKAPVPGTEQQPSGETPSSGTTTPGKPSTSLPSALSDRITRGGYTVNDQGQVFDRNGNLNNSLTAQVQKYYNRGQQQE